MSMKFLNRQRPYENGFAVVAKKHSNLKSTRTAANVYKVNKWYGSKL